MVRRSVKEEMTRLNGVGIGPQRGFDTYAPSLVNGFGFAPLASNALAAVGLFIQIPVSFGFSWVSDHLYAIYPLLEAVGRTLSFALLQQQEGRNGRGWNDAAPRFPHFQSLLLQLKEPRTSVLWSRLDAGNDGFSNDIKLKAQSWHGYILTDLPNLLASSQHSIHVAHLPQLGRACPRNGYVRPCSR